MNIYVYKVFTVTLLFACAVAITEFASALLYSAAPYSGRLMIDMLTGTRDTRSGFSVQPHPYMFYVNTPGWEKDGQKQINSLGYRGNEIDIKKNQETLRILTLGESTTLSFPYVQNPQDTWSTQLEKYLRDRGKKNVEVINGGLNYATSAEILAHYMFRDRYLYPNIVILHIGYNDIIPTIMGDYTPEYTHYRAGWSMGGISLRPGEDIILKLYTIKLIYAWWFKDVSLQLTLGQNKDWYDIPSDEALKRLQQVQPAGFTRNLDLLIRTIQNDGATPIIFPIPLAPKSILSTSEVAGRFVKNYYNVFTEGLEVNKKIMQSIAKKYKVDYVEIDPEKIPLRAYIDHIHVNAEGEAIKARFVGEHVATLISQQSFTVY